MNQEMRSLVHFEFESIIWGEIMVFLYLYSNVKLRYSPSNTSVAFTVGFMNGQVEEKMMMKYPKYITRFVVSCSTT